MFNLLNVNIDIGFMYVIGKEREIWNVVVFEGILLFIFIMIIRIRIKIDL